MTPVSLATIELDPRGTTMCLKRHQHLQFPSLQGWTLQATGGALWITHDGDRQDTIVEPGDAYRVERDTPIVIGALADGGLSLTREPAPRTSLSAREMRRRLAPWSQISALFI